MLKKIIAACAIALFFACSSKDDGFVYGEVSSSSNQVAGTSSSSIPSSSSKIPSSSSEGDVDNSSGSGENSSSSIATTIVQISNKNKSDLFKTYIYGYTMEAGEPEKLAQYWDTTKCTVKSTDKERPDPTCQLDSTNTILRNKLTTQYSDLHYDFPAVYVNNARSYVELKEYILKKAGDQAALGLNVYEGDSSVKDIGELGKDTLNGTSAFTYRYSGAAHTFRIVSKGDADFWYKEVPATASPNKEDTATVRIPTSELVGMGSYATEGAKFDISKVAKFLWTVDFDSTTTSKNTGSFRIENLNAEVKK